MPLKMADIWECSLSGIMYSALGPKAERQLNAPVAISPVVEAQILKHEKAVLAQFLVGYTTYAGREVIESGSAVIVTGHDLQDRRMRILTPRALEKLANIESEELR